MFNSQQQQKIYKIYKENRKVRSIQTNKKKRSMEIVPEEAKTLDFLEKDFLKISYFIHIKRTKGTYV